MWPNLLGLTLAGYLIGSLPWGLWVGWAVARRDIRTGGSGHTGATNTYRQAGLPAALLAFSLDIAKGFGAVWLAQRLGQHPAVVPLAAAAAIAGHCWPVWAGFRGGMGLAAGGGALLALYPLGLVIGIGLAAAGNLALRHTARGNALAALVTGPVVWLVSGSAEAGLAAVAGGLVIFVRALADWRRQYRELWLDRETPAGGRP